MCLKELHDWQNCLPERQNDSDVFIPSDVDQERGRNKLNRCLQKCCHPWGLVKTVLESPNPIFVCCSLDCVTEVAKTGCLPGKSALTFNKTSVLLRYREPVK